MPTEADAPELLPCPFCGKGDAFVEQSTFASSYVICNDCSARGPDECQSSDEEDEPGRDNAITAWNTRTPSEAVAEVERLREALNWIEMFATVRADDSQRVAAKVQRGAMTTIANRARTALNGDQTNERA